MADIDTLLRHRGNNVIDLEGDKIGKLEEIYVDDATGEPEWALVNTGLLGTKSNFVPLQGSQPAGEDLRVQYSKDKVKDSPSVDADAHLDADEEQELYRYYDLQMGTTGTTDTPRTTETVGTTGTTGGTTGTVGHDTSGPTTDDAMTRSEEELEVAKTQRETGRARLRKYVTTDHVDKTVPVQREEVRVEREPVTDGNVGAATDGPAISEEEHEVVLHEEEPVVEKRAVPKERVRLDKETVTEQEHVEGDVRKEEIEVEGGDAGTTR